MKIYQLFLSFAAFTLFCSAQDVNPAASSDLSKLSEVLSFEAAHTTAFPAGWAGGPANTIFLEDKIVHSGKWAARLERRADSEGTFTTLSKAITFDVAGTTVELSGFLRTQDVDGFAGLWLREDGETNGLALDNTQLRDLKGTTEWTKYTVTLPIHREARSLAFGVQLSGTGKVWADDLQLLVDGKPIQQLPKADRAKTAVELDDEFDQGSRVTMNDLSPIQIDNLVTLGKVWGFLKYHHPAIVGGQRHWDYDLFRVLPSVLSAHDRTGANSAILEWIKRLGPVSACTQCAKLETADLHLRPDLGWIDNTALLGAELSQTLHFIYTNRPAAEKQFYVSLNKGVGNPLFDHELGYAGTRAVKFPDAGFQLLALYRFWNIMEYWSPNRGLLGDWDKVVAEFIPRIAKAPSPDAYQLELMALVARVEDTHTNLWTSLQVRPPVGSCQIPVTVRFIGDRAVVAGFAAPDAASSTAVKIGDVIDQLDGVPVAELVKKWEPYYAASNRPTRLRDIGRSLTHGECGKATLKIIRDQETLEATADRIPNSNAERSSVTHDLPGDTFRLLSKDVAYLKLSSVVSSQAEHYVSAAAGTKGLIIDIRNYPSQFMVFALGSLLVDKETPFARVTIGDPANPGAFHFGETVTLTPGKLHYAGKVVILVDEVSVSQSEYTAMAFRASPRAVVVGSTTAGADGNVSPFALPGGYLTLISGIGVFYPDKKPTQRIGIIPDREVRPTIAGIRAARDEVLEEAVRQIVGPAITVGEIRKMVNPPTASSEAQGGIHKSSNK